MGAFPQVPVSGVVDRLSGPSSASEVTRVLSARAFSRPDRIAQVRAALHRAARALRGLLAPKNLKALLALPFRLLLRLARGRKSRPQKRRQKEAEPFEAEGDSSGDEEERRVGHEYARWVRDVAARGRPAPSAGFHFPSVLEACRKTGRQTRFRQVLQLATVALTAALLNQTPWTATAVLPLGVWASFYTDRVLAVRALRSCTNPPLLPAQRDGEGKTAEAGGDIVPFLAEEGKGKGTRHHFLGSGKADPQRIVGMDVRPRPAEEEPPPGDTADPGGSFAMPGALIEGKVLAFQADDVYRHLERELLATIEPNTVDLPDSRAQVFPVSALSAAEWQALDEAQWESLRVLAQQGRHTGQLISPRTARRYLCARRISWDGDLVTSTFISVAYEDQYLQISLRPHVLHPVDSDVRKMSSLAGKQDWRWHSRAMIQAALDMCFAAPDSRRERTRRNSESKDLTCIREEAAEERLDNMFQNEDRQRYLRSTERAIFRIIEEFLAEHNVDLGEFQAQVTQIINNGVIIGGNAENNDIQNQPGSSDSEMSS